MVLMNGKNMDGWLVSFLIHFHFTEMISDGLTNQTVFKIHLLFFSSFFKFFQIISLHFCETPSCIGEKKNNRL